MLYTDSIISLHKYTNFKSSSQAYKLISEPRGLALILSNIHFSSEKDLEYRSGGDVDCASLELLFKHLGYQVTVFHDQSAEVRGILLLLHSNQYGWVCSCYMRILRGVLWFNEAWTGRWEWSLINRKCAIAYQKNMKKPENQRTYNKK